MHINKLLGINPAVLAASAPTFDLADGSSASFADALLKAGLASRAEARPYAMAWAIAKYADTGLKQGQRGLTYTRRDSAAERAVNRVLAICYPSADLPKATGRKHAQSAVEKLVAAFEKLSAAEKRSFKAKIA
jgi:hypothetical protein